MLTPQLGGIPGDESLLDFSVRDSHTLSILARPKHKATGRVVRDSGGLPADIEVANIVENLSIFPETGDVRVISKILNWSLRDSKMDPDGKYEIEVAEGANQFYLRADGYYCIPFKRRFEVMRDGNHRIEDLELRPIPTLSGKVVDDSGKPLRSMIVRTQTDYWFNDVFTQTDEFGKFEIKVRFLPFDEFSNQLKTDLNLLAFDPFGLRAGSIEIDFAMQSPESFENLEITMKEHPIEWVSQQTGISDSRMAKYRKAIEQAREKFSQTIGQSVPNLANGTWLNTSATSLDDFRGKYVLIDFWFVGCGPCASELPSLKLLQAIYGDRPFTIVSVHSGRSETVDTVRAHADQHSMSYPIVVDGPALEIQKEFTPLGLDGFPSYILIGPDGEIVFTSGVDDRLILRNNKFEIIREHLWRASFLR